MRVKAALSRRCGCLGVEPSPENGVGSWIMETIDEKDRRILELVQGDLPSGTRPFDALAGRLGMETGEFITRLNSLRERGIIRSVKAILRHRHAGFSSGAMVVWAVPERDIEEVGKRIASRPEVSHCYERPGIGRYSLFSMIHGKAESEVRRVIEEIAEDACISDYRVYWSLRELKKSSMNYVRGDSGEER